MRIVAVFLVWILFLGGISFYMHARKQAAPVSARHSGLKISEGHYSLEISSTFDLQPDPFAVRRDDDITRDSLLVRMGKEEILKISDPVEAGTLIRADPLEGIIVGYNELYIEAGPPIELSSESRAVRVRILRDGKPVFEKTIWSIPGWKAAGTVYFTADRPSEKETSHEHES